MDKNSLIRKLDYPDIWKEKGLINNELYSTQLHDFVKEYGSKKPEGGTEHFRYGAFCYYVQNSETDEATLKILVEAASKDSDSGMAQSALIDLVSHPDCTSEIYNFAKTTFTKFNEKHFEISKLEIAFKEKVPSWQQNA